MILVLLSSLCRRYGSLFGPPPMKNEEIYRTLSYIDNDIHAVVGGIDADNDDEADDEDDDDNDNDDETDDDDETEDDVDDETDDVDDEDVFL